MVVGERIAVSAHSGQKRVHSQGASQESSRGDDTRYVKQVLTRCSLGYDVDGDGMAQDQAADGVFPLITNVESLSEQEVLEAYKKQPLVEKRFSQLKTDFRVAPVYLKSVRRIESLLCIYFFVLMAEALLERELRQAMKRADVATLPLYPEGRPCRWPTARRIIDVFEGVERHTLQSGGRKPTVMVTELSRVQRKILKLLRLPAAEYGR